MNHFTIVLANNDTLYYSTEISLNDFKKYVSENDFIEIERNHNQIINGRTYFRPHKASYQTKSIVYIEDTTERHKEMKEHNDKIDKMESELIKTITQYKFNKRMHFWFFLNIGHYYNKDIFTNINLNISWLQRIANKCEKYKCEKI